MTISSLLARFWRYCQLGTGYNGLLSWPRPRHPTDGRVIRMFELTELSTTGVVDLIVLHPRTLQTHCLQFYVNENHTKTILGFKVCKDFHFLMADEAHIDMMDAWNE